MLMLCLLWAVWFRGLLRVPWASFRGAVTVKNKSGSAKKPRPDDKHAFVLAVGGGKFKGGGGKVHWRPPALTH